MIPQSFIQDLLNRVDIVDVVGSYVQLKKGGANLLGLCPFHSEKSPSFTVSPSKQFFHCFGCGKNGTAIGFLMEYSGLSFVEAIKTLAQNAGLTVPEEDNSLPLEQRIERQAKSLALSDVMTQAYQHYRKQLRTAPHAITYLKNRGLTGEIAARYGLGYAPDSWDSLRELFLDYNANTLVESGLVIDRNDESRSSHKRYDRFRDRIIFPIRNSKGQTIAFGGRVLGQGEPKYLNSPETALFHKGSELYGLFEARQAMRDAGYVLVTEGYMDVVALAQYGFPQTVATLGTACTPTHVQKLLRQTDCIIFSFDGDAAGRRAGKRALEASLPHAGDNKTIKFLFLPTEHDPDSFIRQYGTEAFGKLVQDATPLSQFLLQIVAEESDLHTAEGRARIQYTAKPLLQAMKASALRLQIVHSLAQLTQTTPSEIEVLLELAKPASRTKFAPMRNKRPQPVGIERKIMRLLLAQPKLASTLAKGEIDVISRISPESGGMLEQLLNSIMALGEHASFATLAEQLRLTGSDFESLITDIATSKDFDHESAKTELADAVRQIIIRNIKVELEKLHSTGLQSGMSLDEIRQRHNELLLEQKKLLQNQ